MEVRRSLLLTVTVIFYAEAAAFKNVPVLQVK